MNDKVYKVLEYDKIIEMLKAEAASPMGRDAAGETVPLTEDYKIRELLTETDEAVSVILHKGTLPLGGLQDVKRKARYAEKGGVLGMGELLGIRSSLKVAEDVYKFLDDEEITYAPGIKAYLEVLRPESRLREHIERCIISEDEMADSASPALRDIRRKIENQRQSARARLSSMVSSSGNRELLQDAVITMRDGRLVIPVKLENRSKFPGIVHDRSSTGSTLFIEPQAVVDINNEIRELELKEQEEIRRILAELSKEVGMCVRSIVSNQKYLVRLDVIFARGRLSVKQGAFAAKLNDRGVIDIRRGRHPLLPKEKAVPVDVSAGETYRTLVITGPNTGGKTVMLKTVGLMMLMTQSGLHIPAAEGTTLPVMKKIFADIGDEQSIEQSMSTFSGHMKNVVDIQKEADGDTFILLDELGAGTDPVEGAALAIAILENLAAAGALIFATTHYSELKKYALATPGVENASMEFDIETLSPTYRLIIGAPGKSNAFEISRKLGLADSIIEEARHLLGNEDIEFENVVSALETDRRSARSKLEAAEALSEDLKRRQAEIERKERELVQKKEKILERAREEAEETINEARNFAEKVRSELREIEKEARTSMEAAKSKRLEVSTKIRKKGEKFRREYDSPKPVNTKPARREELAVGDRVNVVTLGQKGVVASLPDSKDELNVQIGNMKFKVSLGDITKIEKSGVQKHFEKTKFGSMYKEKTMSIQTSINVIGKTLDEAIAEVDKYLDDAFMSGLPEVTVVHGKGAGILSSGIRNMLRHHPHVKSFHAGDIGSGGEGVTVVEMK